MRQYQTFRSVSDVHVFVLYDAVPRKQCPWQGNRSGDVEALKPEYRLALARDGYMLVGASTRCSIREASWLLPVLGELCYLRTT